jgi:hypothetical protein
MYSYLENSMFAAILRELRGYRSFRGLGDDRRHTIWTWLCLRSIEGLSRLERVPRLRFRS